MSALELCFAKWVTPERFHAVTGKKPKAMEHLRYSGAIAEGVHWKYGPDALIYYNLSEWDAWVESASKASLRGRRRSLSTSEPSDTSKSDSRTTASPSPPHPPT